MKKSVRINLLVITIVVTLFIFGGLWYLRPGVSDEILQQAQIRQSQPLMEINEPLRKPKAEDLIDTAQLAKDLKRDLEPSIKASIKADLLADPAFAKPDTAALQQELQTAIKADLLTDPAFFRAVNLQVDAQAIRREIQPAILRGVLAELSSDSAFIRSISSQLDFSSIQAANDQALAAVSRANDQAIASLRREITAQIAALPKPTTVDAVDEEAVQRMIAQAVDAQIPMVVEAVVASIEANRDLYIEAVRSELGDVILEDEVVDLYLGYRNALVQDLVPAILDDVEALIKGEPTPSEVAIVEEVKKAPDKPAAPVIVPTPVVPEAPVVPTVTEAAVVPVAPEAPMVPTVTEAPVVPAVPAPPTPAKIKVTSKAVPMTPAPEVKPTPAPPVIEPAPAPPVIEPAVSAPVAETLSEEKVVAYEVDESAYEVERQRLRTEAINEVLKKIGQ